MSDLLNELSRACNLRVAGDRMLEISSSLGCPAVAAVRQLEGTLNVRESDILIAACVVLLLAN